MARLIDADALEEKGVEFSDTSIYVPIEAVWDAPAVDAVEVVRCRDCKFYTEQKKRCDHPCQDWDVECFDQWLEMEPNDFCSYGERRESDGR